MKMEENVGDHNIYVFWKEKIQEMKVMDDI
jgi:hypothetical protein